MNTPDFEKIFPKKSIWVGNPQNEPIEIAFSSFEEAEWKLLNDVPKHELFDALGKVLMSDPSSMNFPFDTLRQEEVVSSSVVSEDGLARFIGVSNDIVQLPPSMIIQYKLNGEVRVAGTELEVTSYYSLCPITVDGFKKDNSTLYYVWGNGDPRKTWMGSRMRAYELDDNGLRPAFVYEGDNALSCITTDYFDFENEVGEAILHEALTKEQSCHFLYLSDEMFEFSRYASVLARAAVRHQMGVFWLKERNEKKVILNLQYMIDELLDATEKFGRNADWDEYLRNVPEVLCHYYNDKRDIENLKKYAAIAKRLKK